MTTAPAHPGRHDIDAMTAHTRDARPGPSPTARVACTHCTLEVPPGLIDPNADHQFCCDACRLVHSTIHSCGLDQYYAIRERLGAEGQLALTHAPAAGTSFAEFDDPAFLEVYARPAPAREGSTPAGATAPTTVQPLRIDLLLEGVHCAACLWLVERLPRIVCGVIDARLDLRRAVVSLEWDPGVVRLSAIAHALASLGYRPHAITDTAAHEARRRQDRAHLVRIGVAAACSGNAMLLAFALYAGDFDGMRAVYAHAFRWLSVALGLLSLLWPGRVFIDGALAALRARLWHLDTPIAIALVGGNIAGIFAAIRGSNDLYADSLTMLTFLLLVGRWLQVRQQRHALDAVELLFSLTPGVAHLVENAGTREVSVQSLRPGQIVEVRPQETIPVDGVVALGASAVDASILTGESRPVAVGEGDAVVAGSVNLASTIRVRVSAVGRETRAGRMMATIEELSRRRTPIVGSAQRLAAPYVIVVTAMAVLTLALHAHAGLDLAASHAIALLVSTCPCAVALATPLVVTIAVGRAARSGVLIKGGDVFERLARPGTIVLDKTGTLTTGRFGVLEWRGDASLRPLVASIEAGSTHPIAVALSQGAAGAVRWPGTIEHRLGQGVIASTIDAYHDGADGTDDAVQAERADNLMAVDAPVGEIRIGSPRWIAAWCGSTPAWVERAVQESALSGHTPVLVAVDRRVAALAVLGDEVRPEAPAALAALGASDWRMAMLSGDDPGVVRAVADRLGIDPQLAWGGMSPEQKHEQLEALKREARGTRRSSPVVMVGDGVNDAAALAAADVGIALRGGAEASLAAADVYIERGGLSAIADLSDASRRVMRTIRVCLTVAVSYNLLAAGLAMAGALSPLLAAAMMPVSSLSILSVAIHARSFTPRATGEGARLPSDSRAADRLAGLVTPLPAGGAP